MSVSFRFITRTLALALVASVAASRTGRAQTTATQEPAGETQRTTSAPTAPSATNPAPSSGVTPSSLWPARM